MKKMSHFLILLSALSMPALCLGAAPAGEKGEVARMWQDATRSYDLGNSRDSRALDATRVLLLQRKLNPNIDLGNGMTPLNHAASTCDLEAVNLLVENGADPDFSPSSAKYHDSARAVADRTFKSYDKAPRACGAVREYLTIFSKEGLLKQLGHDLSDLQLEAQAVMMSAARDARTVGQNSLSSAAAAFDSGRNYLAKGASVIAAGYERAKGYLFSRSQSAR